MKQTCVYWAPIGTDSYGQRSFADPVEKSCRWEDVAKQFINKTGTGTMEVSRSYVMVDDVTVGGLLMLGTLGDVVDEDTPRNNEEAHEIRQVESVPNIKNTVTYVWAYL